MSRNELEDRNKIEPRYRPDTINDSGFELLFDKILQCGTFPAQEERSDSKCFDRLDVYSFIEFVFINEKKKLSSLKRLLNDTTVSWDTFRKIRYRPVSEEVVTKVLCATAQIKKYPRNPLLHVMADLILYSRWKEKSIRPLLNHEKEIKELIASVDTEQLVMKDFALSLSKNLGKKGVVTTGETGYIITFENDIYKIAEGAATQRLIVPNFEENLTETNVSSLLGWAYKLSPFTGRKSEILELRNWVDSPPHRSIKCLYGEGGVGKTRLAFRIAEIISEEGWAAGQTYGDFVGNWIAGEAGTLFIIDYPEERKTKCEEFVRAIKEMPNSDSKVRVLLLARNPVFAESLTDVCPGLLDVPIHLTGLTSETDLWCLFSGTYNKYCELLGQQNARENDTLSLDEPGIRQRYISWLKQSESHTNPLMTIALAVYLASHSESAVLEREFELKGVEVIRYFTKKEEFLIVNELKRHNNNQRCSEEVDIGSMLLLKAITAICVYLDEIDIREYSEYISLDNVDYKIPKTSTLRSLSILSSGKLEALSPDIIAADFLAYCLDKYAKGNAGFWVLPLLAQDFYDVRRGDEFLDRIARLKRLVDDAVNILGHEWPIEDLSQKLNYYPNFCEKFVELTSDKELGSNLNPFLAQALRIAVSQKSISPEKRSFYYSVIGSLPCVKEEEAIYVLYQAIQLLNSLAEQDKDKFGPSLAANYFHLAQQVASIGNFITAISAAEAARAGFKKYLDHDRPSYTGLLLKVELLLSDLYSKNDDNDLAVMSMHEAVRLHGSLPEENFDYCINDMDIYVERSIQNIGRDFDTQEAAILLTALIEYKEQLIKRGYPEIEVDLLSYLLTYTKRFGMTKSYIERLIELYNHHAQQSMRHELIAEVPKIMDDLLSHYSKNSDNESVEFLRSVIPRIQKGN